jgi:hypothetical protein
MVNQVALSPYRRAEYNFDIDFITRENYIWIGLISKNGIPVTFQIMDRENNMTVFTAVKKVEFMAKLEVKRRERLKFILINEDTGQVRTPGEGTSN